MFDWERLEGDRLKSVVAHEVFHCWQGANAPSFTSYLAQEDFFFEGMATWVGEQYATGSSFGTPKFRTFFSFEKYPLFDSEYTAYGFWSQVAHIRGGPDALWRAIPGLNDIADSDAGLWNRALDGVPAETQATLAATAVRQPELSSSWNFDAVGLSGLGRRFISRALEPGSTSSVRVERGQQAAVTFSLDALPITTAWVVSRQSSGLTLNRWDTGDDFAVIDNEMIKYCYGELCECPDGTSPLPDILYVPFGSQYLDVALTGAANASAMVTMFVQDIANFCDEPAEPSEPTGSGAFDGNGTWRATNPALKLMFENASALGFGVEPLSIAAVTGDVVMELGGDGTGTLTYTDVTAVINNNPFPDLTINGSGQFQFGVEAGVFSVVGNTFEVSASSSALFGEVLTITESDIEGGSGGVSSFTVGFGAGDQLVLTGAEGSRGELFFPLLWTRID